MRKESFMAKFLAVILSFVLFVGLVVTVAISGIKPICISIMKDVVVNEVNETAIVDIVDEEIPMTDAQSNILGEVVEESEELDELIDVYLKEAGVAIAGGEMDLKDTGKLYEAINDDLVEKYAQKEDIELTDEMKKNLTSKLEAREKQLEGTLDEVIDETMASNSKQARVVATVYDALFTTEAYIWYAIILFVIALMIVILRFKSKGWLMNIGIACICAGLVIIFIPALIAIAESLVLQGGYEIVNKNYYIKFAAMIGVVGIAFVGIKSKILDNRIVYEIIED